MEWAVVALAAIITAAQSVIIWRQQTHLRALSELLASRSFGEYAQGRAKLDGNEQKPKPFDPGF
jgi:hypothetical protein